MASTNTIIYGVNSNNTSYYKELYNKIKQEFARRNLPNTVNNSNMSQFLTQDFDNLYNLAKSNSIIEYNHAYLTINQLMNGKIGKINTNTPITQQQIIPTIDEYIQLIENFSQGIINSNNQAETKCGAICIGMCFGACFSTCNGCTSCTGVRR